MAAIWKQIAIAAERRREWASANDQEKKNEVDSSPSTFEQRRSAGVGSVVVAIPVVWVVGDGSGPGNWSWREVGSVAWAEGVEGQGPS